MKHEVLISILFISIFSGSLYFYTNFIAKESIVLHKNIAQETHGESVIIHDVTLDNKREHKKHIQEREINTIEYKKTGEISEQLKEMGEKSNHSVGYFSDSFNTKDTSFPAWKSVQLQGGSIDFTSDPSRSGNTVLKMTAGAKQGGKVGKAGLIQRIPLLEEGHKITVSGKFYFPEETDLNSILLIDLECAKCGMSTNPGVRLYLREGRLRIDLSKIGINQSLYSSVDKKVLLGAWNDIRMQLDLSDQDDIGRNRVYLNGVRVLDEFSKNIISEEVVEKYGMKLIGEGIDRVQMGITANSQAKAVVLYMDDVSISYE